MAGDRRMTGCRKKGVSALLCAALLAGLAAGCGSKKDVRSDVIEQDVKIPMILTVDPSTGKKNEQKVVDGFNQAFDGKYEVEVEWIMETEDEYRQNLKRLNVTDELPAILTDLRMLPSFYQKMVADGRIEDLSDEIAEDKEWKEMIEPAVLESCGEEDGSIYLAPLSSAVFACSGVFWNEELFAQAGITKFPETWEEFWAACDKLSANGITPLALHTDGTAWAPMLLATARVAATEDGAAFMKELYPDTYQNESGLLLAETLKKLFTYTTDDALHTDFDTSYHNFFSGEAAMIPNGYWMIDQIPEEWEGKVRFSAFPENKLICSPETFGWALVSDYSEEVKEGALEFLKYRTARNKSEAEYFLNDKKQHTSQVERDYIEAYQNHPQFVPNYQVKWNSILQEETLEEYLPQLVTGKMTTEMFTKMEDESIARFQKEQ